MRDSTKENELITSVTYLLHRHKVFQSLKISVETFLTFIAKIQSGYKDITYHNKTHAADVSTTVYYMLTTCDMWDKAAIDDIEFTAMIVGGACHDHEHFGYNNNYLIETKDEIATRYNDVSVLENHHVASTFAILKKESYDIFINFEKADYKKMRKHMIGCILATDMQKHFSDLGKFKSRVSSPDFDSTNGGDKELAMHLAFHLSDISNPAKRFDICRKWTELLYVEFFIQGDMERDKGMPISYLMDRTTTNLAKA